MKKIFSIVLASALAFSFTGCKDWLDINTSLDDPITVTANSVMPAVLFYATQQVYDFAEYGTYLSQCLTTTGKSPSSSYAYKVGWGGFLNMNRHPQWRRCYFDIGVNVRYMIEDAQAKDMRNYELIGYTLLLHSLLTTTDMFGDIPLKESYAFSMEVADRTPNPKYDTQESVYEYLEQEFQRVLALYDDTEWINCPTNGTITVAEDRMFAGDMGKWRAFTKALYARFLVRQIPNLNNTPEMCDKIVAAVDAALTDPSWAEPIYKFDGGTAEKCCMWGPAQPKMNLGWAQARENLLTDAVPSDFFAAMLGTYQFNVRYFDGGLEDGTIPSADQARVDLAALDPRGVRMMHPRVDAAGTKNRGLYSLRANVGMDVAKGPTFKKDFFPDLYCNTDTLAPQSNPYTRNDGYIAFITKEELLFDKAEALYWKGNKAEAYEVTKQAVEASLERYGVGSSQSWEGNPMKIVKDIALNMFYNLRVPAPGGEDGFNISHLMQQKYVALYLQPEQWNDIRRYNYSCASNGITYDNVFVYDVNKVWPKDEAMILGESQYNASYKLTRPSNIYKPHWDTDKDHGTTSTLSANAFINRINPDPETEEKYNREELVRIGAFQNPDYLRKRMIWQKPVNAGSALTSQGDGEWM